MHQLRPWTSFSPSSYAERYAEERVAYACKEEVKSIRIKHHVLMTSTNFYEDFLRVVVSSDERKQVSQKALRGEPNSSAGVISSL